MCQNIPPPVVVGRKGAFFSPEVTSAAQAAAAQDVHGSCRELSRYCSSSGTAAWAQGSSGLHCLPGFLAEHILQVVAMPCVRSLAAGTVGAPPLARGTRRRLTQPLHSPLFL